MKKYLLITLLTLSLFSCSKNVSLDGVNINTSSGLNISTPEGSMGIDEDGVQIMSNQGNITVGSGEMNIQTQEGTASIGSDGIQGEINNSKAHIGSNGVATETQDGNIELNEKGLEGNVDGVGKMSITNNGTTVGGITIASGTVAGDTVKNAVDEQVKDLDINMNGLDNLMNDALQNSNAE